MRTPLIEKLIGTTEIHKILIEKILSEYENGQAEGESIHIADSANLPMILRPQGQIIQDTRNGYNLLPLYKYIDVGFTKTINGITITVLDDFSIKVTGKRTLNTPIDFYLFGQFTSTAEVLKLNGVYTFSISENPYTGIRGFLLHNSNVCLDTNTNNKVISEELENITVSALLIRIETDNELNEIIQPMLYEGSEEKEYDAFGQMPSTIFPSPIKNVEGDYDIRVNNKNLAQIETLDINWKLTENGITNLNRNAGSKLTEIKLKKDEKVYINFKLLKVKTTTMDNDMTFTGYINNVQTTSLSFGNIQRNKINEIVTREYKANEDCTLSYILWGNVLSETFEFQFWITKEPDTDYIRVQQQNLPLTMPDEIKLYGENDGFVYLTKEQATELELDEGWYVVNNYKERNFSKEPLLTAKTAGPFSQGYYIIFDDIKSRASLDGNTIYSTHQKQKAPANPSTDAEWLKMDGNSIGQLYPSVHNGVYINYAPETKQEFVDWFNNLAPTIVYPVEKAVYTKITDKNFIKQLEELQKVFSYEGVTNVDTYSTDDKEKSPLILNVEYLKSQKIINKNLDERITALENALINNI